MCSHARPVRVAAETGRCVSCACVSVQTLHSTQVILRDSSWWCKTDGPFNTTSASELNIIKATHTDLTSPQYFLLWWAAASQKDSRKQYKELWIWHFKSQTFALRKMPLKTKARDTNRFSWMNFLGATLYNILPFKTPFYLTEHELYEMHFHQLFFPGLNQFKRSESFQQTGLLIIKDGPSISQDCKWNRKPISLCLLKHPQINQQTKDRRKEMKTENEETWKGRRETDEDQKRTDTKIERRKVLMNRV